LSPAQDIQLTGKYNLTEGKATDDVWAISLQRSFSKMLSALNVFATNAAGRSGVGAMLSGKIQVGVTLTWQPCFWLC
jgi:hypothetical protein